MTNTKYGHLICTELTEEARQKDLALEGSDRMKEHVIWMDSEVIPGAMYSECVWFSPGFLDSPEEMRKREGLGAHTHPFDEVIGFFGTDLNDPYDLGGEIELWLEDEKFEMKNSFLAHVPAGMKHCPLKNIAQDRRMFHFTLGPGKEYTRQESVVTNTPKPEWDVRKHVVSGLKDAIATAPWSAGPKQAGNGKGGRLLYLDSEVVPGAFYVETVWVTPLPDDSEDTVFPGGDPVEKHSHDFDEVIAFFGTDPDNIHDLCGEVELWLGGEKHIIDKSCMVFVPAGLEHCPLRFNRVDRPIFYFTAGPGSMYF